MAVTTTTVSGPALEAWVDALAQLRITVFREFPYLYDGDRSYEERYLRTYVRSSNAMAVLALDGETVVGASTGLPMSHETEEFIAPFIAAGYDPAQVFYCGESILLAPYRGQGLYRRFFAGREAYARALPGMKQICFCAVQRAADHPLRPADYQPLDPVWRHFGYQPQPALTAHYSWKDIDQPRATRHALRFWLKNLDSPAP